MINKLKFNGVKDEIKQNIDNLIIATLICIPLFSYLINFDNVIPIFLFFLFVFTLFYKKPSLSFLKNIDKTIFFFFVCFLICIVLNLIIFQTDEFVIIRLLYFLVYGALPVLILYILYISRTKINLLNIIRIINFFYAIGSIFIFNRNFWVYDVSGRMSISYYFLPILVSLFFELYLDRPITPKKILLKLIIYTIIYLPYFKFTITFMSRGAILATILCIYLTIISVLEKKLKKIIIIISFLLILIGIFFGVYILEFIQNILFSLNISFRFVDKNLQLLLDHSIGNGRDVIYSNAIIGIYDHPVFGNGIGSFERIYGTYPHNFILQTWYEAGFLYMLIMTLPIFYSILRIIFSEHIDKKIKYSFIFIFSIGIVRLFLSFEYWKEMFYWIYLFMSLLLIQYDLKYHSQTIIKILNRLKNVMERKKKKWFQS